MVIHHQHLGVFLMCHRKGLPRCVPEGFQVWAAFSGVRSRLFAGKAYTTMISRFCSLLLSCERRKRRRPDTASSLRSGNALSINEVPTESWKPSPLTVQGLVGMLRC